MLSKKFKWSYICEMYENVLNFIEKIIIQCKEESYGYVKNHVFYGRTTLVCKGTALHIKRNLINLILYWLYCDNHLFVHGMSYQFVGSFSHPPLKIN